MTVSTSDITLGDFCFYGRHWKPTDNHVRDGGNLLTTDMIELKHDRIGLSTVYARMSLEVLQCPSDPLPTTICSPILGTLAVLWIIPVPLSTFF